MVAHKQLHCGLTAVAGQSILCDRREGYES
jgi:hypothetical protein